MNNWFLKVLGGGGIFIFSIGAIAGIAYLTLNFIKRPASEIISTIVAPETSEAGVTKEKGIEELVKEAQEYSQNVKGIYMTAVVANDSGKAATRLRNDIIRLIDTTELNGVVIDIKETDGVFLPESLKDFVTALHQKNIWVIARLVVFNDTIKAKASLGIALKRKNGKIWLDRRGNGWLDPASKDAWDYITGVAKTAIDYGFDEIQFDYIRFPSDGDVENIVYPIFNSKIQQKYDVLKEFFSYLDRELKAYRPQIILSADLFGYVILQKSDLGIGQRMEDLGDSFDYISFMVYPSHYYSGFQVFADPQRGLPALYYPYKAKSAAQVVSGHPYEVVYRSMLVAYDFLSGKDVFGTSTPASILASDASTTPGKEPPVVNNGLKERSRAKLRPWLQDFDLKVDTSRGIYYDAEKVKAQIRAAEEAGASGWLLWNPGNTYTEAALRKD